jgi:hypothetical protein
MEVIGGRLVAPYKASGNDVTGLRNSEVSAQLFREPRINSTYWDWPIEYHETDE